ncbi:MAG: N-acetylmuramoyl-L-alanine amidase [Bacilli bacterium]|nr:N-acetylmuramoyl-L-alanine amidase [Bacilli bacterium]
MKKIILLILILINCLLYIPTIAQSRKLILNNLIIVIDPGHGGKDVGTSFDDIYEKDINLSISLLLKKELESYGANIILTREGDYDLSTPNATLRKKSDFNNRIKLINESNADLVISIHQNYYKDSKYSGTQIFYKDSKEIADYLQSNINQDRLSKPISNSLYMYRNINTKVLLIECGFLSNYHDRITLTNKEYQKKYSASLAKYISEYYKNN